MMFRIVHNRSGLYFKDAKNGKPDWTSIKCEAAFFDGQDFGYIRSLGLDPVHDVDWERVVCHDTNH